MNNLWSGSCGPMASALPTAMPAVSNQVWRRQSHSRGGTGGSGSGPKALSGSPPMRSSPSLPTWLACHEDPRYWTNANNGDRYWRFSGKSHIRLPGRRSRSRFPAFRATRGSKSGRLGWGEPSPCHVIERDAWHLFPLKNQKVGNNRDSPIRAERTASSRPQPQMNEPELGDSVPMASSLPTAMPAASSEVWSHPSCGRGGTGASGSRRRPLPVPLSRHLLRTSRLGCWCHAGPRYWIKANNGDRYLRFGGKLHIRLPGRRSRSLFPALRATRGSESGRLG